MNCLNQTYSDTKFRKNVILCRAVIRNFPFVISRINFFCFSVFIRQGSPYSFESVPITFLYGSTPLVCPSPTGIISIKRISVPFFATYRVSATTSVCGVSTTLIFTLIPHSIAALIPCFTSSSSGFL